MSNVGIGWHILILFLFPLILLSGCITRSTFTQTPQELVENAPDPTPADSLEELVVNLASEDPTVRFVSAWELEKYGRKARIAVPALIENLEYEGSSKVRSSAAVALGRLGLEAQQAVPKLISVVQNELEAPQVKSDAIEALGKIGDKTAIPALVNLLYQEDSRSIGLDRESAKSIAMITGERFTDSGEEDNVYTLNEEGIPLIVIDARKWWEEEGQYLDW